MTIEDKALLELAAVAAIEAHAEATESNCPGISDSSPPDGVAIRIDWHETALKLALGVLRLTDDLDFLQQFNRSLADRCAKQSKLLSRQAELREPLPN